MPKAKAAQKRFEVWALTASEGMLLGESFATRDAAMDYGNNSIRGLDGVISWVVVDTTGKEPNREFSAKPRAA